MIIVSGLARSGTSLMMNMLEAGGIPVLTDGVRQADESNPQGYKEVEAIGKKLGQDPQYLNGKKGCVKVLSPFLRAVEGNHRVIFMERDIGEIAASMGRMSGRLITEREMAALERHIESTKLYLNERANIPGCSFPSPNSLQVLYVDYNQLVTDPTPEIEKLLYFVSELDIKKALQVIDKRLYRNRRP